MVEVFVLGVENDMKKEYEINDLIDSLRKIESYCSVHEFGNKRCSFCGKAVKVTGVNSHKADCPFDILLDFIYDIEKLS